MIRLDKKTVRLVVQRENLTETCNAIKTLSNIDYIQVEHGVFSDEESNLIQISMKNPEIKRLVSTLAVNGFHAYEASGTRTKFVRQDEIPSLWHKVRSGEYKVSEDGLIHTLESDASSPPESLLVIFSSMADVYNKSSLMRYFEQNFKSASKHVPQTTAILRIADVGGVVGGFYMPTVYDPDAASKVSRLIGKTISQLNVASSRTVLYGASKGGTGALYHGLISGLKCISVDPVINDDYYERRYSDSHWTSESIFIQRKQAAFDGLLDRTTGGLNPRSENLVVVSSPGSPLWPSISEYCTRIDPLRVQLLISNSPNITDHPHVSQQTLRTVVGLINTGLAGIEIPAGKTYI
ncbi:hypothetical protein CQ019_06180 [Arthrobacter sp. MYb229]|uniref:XcbB/CpsF family capsular polysaccharide biosynthesis protein n=1 Tax=unclassified Arthrobacter TaxID=235627 RepID=UPI000CFD1E71|nr:MULTISPECIES: XcbB/CpsF family capsular polysaccharide biosynthesis protein [unclassified Arthrobacter]PRA06934.1 hypothetical protein CQ019_06180 [Arthrobacter sp. MYb229]PRB47882.1 hypothetical protein CQ013_15975 [Arthrobacter sp. MYb216]